MAYLEDDTHMALLHSELHGWGECEPTICCICGKDAEGFASFDEPEVDGLTEWICEACCEDELPY